MQTLFILCTFVLRHGSIAVPLYCLRRRSLPTGIFVRLRFRIRYTQNDKNDFCILKSSRQRHIEITRSIIISSAKHIYPEGHTVEITQSVIISSCRQATSLGSICPFQTIFHASNPLAQATFFIFFKKPLYKTYCLC